MAKATVTELKKRLEYLEETPIYIGEDGMPSAILIFSVFITGIIPGLILLYILRKQKIESIRRQIENKQ